MLIGEQHISDEPTVIGYDEVVEVDTHHASEIVPIALDRLASTEQPFFLSVGFFETHRDFGAPTSVRDSLYSQPPPNLPDTPVTRAEMAAFKASARSLDQGIGAVLNGLHQLGLNDNDLDRLHHRPRAGVPGREGDAVRRGTGVMLLMRGPGGLAGGKVYDSMVSQLDLYPTLCELAGIESPGHLQGTSLMPLVRGEVESLHQEVFTEVTYHAAYEPQRAVRTERWKYIRRFGSYPYTVLANCDDSASKELLVERGWGEELVDPEQLYDLALDPQEAHNLVDDPNRAQVLEEMRERLERWMKETEDPLLEGPVEAPAGAFFNLPWQRSADEPAVEGPANPEQVTADPTGAPSR